MRKKAIGGQGGIYVPVTQKLQRGRDPSKERKAAFYQITWEGFACQVAKLLTKYRRGMECLTLFAGEKVTVTTCALTYSSHCAMATFMSSLTAHSVEYATSPTAAVEEFQFVPLRRTRTLPIRSMLIDARKYDLLKFQNAQHTHKTLLWRIRQFLKS